MVKIIIDAKTLAALAVAVSKEETRYYICGVHFEAMDGKLAAVATDGTIMARALCDTLEHCDLPDGPVTVPKEVLAKCKHKQSGLAVFDGGLWRVYGSGLDSVHKLIDCDDVTLSIYQTAIGAGQVIDGTFPDWRRVESESFEPVERIGLDLNALESLVKVHKAIGEERLAFRFAGEAGVIRLESGCGNCPTTEGLVMHATPVRVC